MIGEKTSEFLRKHSFCAEYLFKDWELFLDVLYAEGGCVSAILWWDYCKVSQQHESVGSGGYRDPGNPEYMFAETQFYENGFESKSLEEIKAYIAGIQKNGLPVPGRHTFFKPVPSFYLAD